jgi:ferredoxin
MTRIVIDTERCSGNGRCYTLAPDLFADDDRGYGQVIGDGAVREDQLDLARRVVIACPENAITIVDEAPRR